jgi:signal transduction histidine kinase
MMVMPENMSDRPESVNDRPESLNSSYREITRPLSALEIENQRLKDQVLEYEFLMNNHPHGCLIVQEGKIAYINKTAYKLLGYQMDKSLIGRELKELICHEDRSCALADLNRALADLNMRGEKESSGTDVAFNTFSFCVPTGDGGMKFSSGYLSTSISYRGKPATCFIIKDVLEIDNELSGSILRSKTILQQAVDAIYDGITVIDKDYTIRMMNKKSLQMCGEDDFRKVIGKQCFSIFHKRTAPCRNCPARKTLRTGETPSPVERIITQNGKNSSYRLFLFPLCEGEEVRYVVKYQRDLSRERELQDQLIHSERLATLGMLAGKISHEINNPLTSIIGIAQLMANQEEENEQIGLIVKEGLRIRKLAQDLTSLGRPSQNKPSDVVLHDVLNTVLSLTWQIPGQGKNYRLERKYLPDSPVVFGDPDQIEQVFLNLVMNAAHAMQLNPTHGVLTVGTKMSTDGRFAIGYVKDNGCGINEKDKERLFEPFFTTKKGGEGTGIGLSVVKEIVNKHHGMINFESKENEGTTFEIYLPLSKPADGR